MNYTIIHSNTYKYYKIYWLKCDNKMYKYDIFSRLHYAGLTYYNKYIETGRTLFYMPGRYVILDIPAEIELDPLNIDASIERLKKIALLI